jgi:hypothetical protein
MTRGYERERKRNKEREREQKVAADHMSSLKAAARNWVLSTLAQISVQLMRTPKYHNVQRIASKRESRNGVKQLACGGWGVVGAVSTFLAKHRMEEKKETTSVMDFIFFAVVFEKQN